MKLKPSLFPAILLLAVLAIQLLPGCTPSPERSRLEHIEAIIDEHPDSAMILIDSVDTAALRSDRDRALYGMLLTEALDKNHQNPSNDPLITSAINYFADKGERRREMIATYYGARVQYLNNDFSHAIVRFFRAKEIAEELSEHFWHGMAARGISDIYYKSFNRAEQLKFAKEEFDNLSKAQRQPYLNYALLDYATAIYNYGDYKSAIAFSRQILDSADTYNDIYLKVDALKLLGLANMSTREFSSAILIFENLLNSTFANSSDSLYLCLAYIGDNKPILAKRLFSKVSNGEPSLRLAVSHRINEASGNYRAALSDLNALYDSRDSVLRDYIKMPASTSTLDYLHMEKEKNKATLETSRKSLFLIILGLGFLVLLLSYFFHLYILKQKREIEDSVLLAEALKEQLSLEVSKHEMTVVSSNRKIEEYDKKISDAKTTIKELLSSKYEVLEDVCQILRECDNSAAAKRKIANVMTSFINEISLDGKKLDMLEERVNEIYGNVMKEIRKDLPDMKEIDYNLYLFMILGISNPSISILLKEKKINAVYDRKRRLKDKIKALSPVLQSKYMAPFS
ncbi:MAG TPA: hypothetical protein DCE24_03285 [Porphyromonadaceae bacterium]|nr:hypothetical protein [Porphyromonadaceae bacterium]